MLTCDQFKGILDNGSGVQQCSRAERSAMLNHYRSCALCREYVYDGARAEEKKLPKETIKASKLIGKVQRVIDEITGDQETVF